MKIIGLMSGTSMDGVTGALSDIKLSDGELDVDLIDYETFPYPEDLKNRLMDLVKGGSVKGLCRANFEIGEQFASVANRLMRRTEGAVELIGSHGQTVCHSPPTKDQKQTFTLQIGEPDVIAEATGVTTVADFRTRDVAAGGEGAPLIPYVDYRLFQSSQEDRVALNLGGIANVTYLPKGGTIDDLIAFDTGPGNMVIDQLVREYTRGKREYDEDGLWAEKGNVDKEMLSLLMEHSYIRKEPPKTTGREDFGEEFTKEVIATGKDMGLSREDVLATVTRFTVEAVKKNCSRHLSKIDSVIAAGGGTKNNTLMRELRSRLDPKVVTTDDFGIPPEAKEAVGFALLAHETHRDVPSNVPGATGAIKQVLLGKVSKVFDE